MKKKILSSLLVIVLAVIITGCGTSNKSDSSLNQDKEEIKENVKDSSNKEVETNDKEKIVVCKQEDTFYPKMESVYLKGDKLVKVVNNHQAKERGKQFDAYCKDVQSRYDKSNNVKGLSITINCNTSDMSVFDEEIYIIDEIENFDDLVGEAFPSQLGGAYFDENTHELNLKFWLEGKNTQGYTCEEN